VKFNLILTSLVASHLVLNAQLQETKKASRHRLGLQVPVWFNANAQFKGKRASTPGNDDGDPFTFRIYDNGFNRVDSTGNLVSPPPPGKYSINRTSFFGYQDSSQVVNDTDFTDSELIDPHGGTLSLHSAAISGGEYEDDVENDVVPGIELFYRYEWIEKENWTLDWEASFSYQFFNWDEGGTVGANIHLITDVYSLGGVVLQDVLAPYSGPFGNLTPGIPVIGSVPSRRDGSVPAVVIGNRDLEMHSVIGRIGPAFDWKVTPKWRFGLLTGLALGWAETNFEYSETTVVSVPAVPAVVNQGDSTETHFWVGLYSAVRLTWQFQDHWDVHCELRHIYQENLNHEDRFRSAEIDLSDGMSGVFGISYRF
jgi:hypothetical protein